MKATRGTDPGSSHGPPPLHSGQLRSELPAPAEGPYLHAPLPMAAHLREPRSQSPRSSSLGLVPFSKRIQLLARKLPVADQVRHFPLGDGPPPRPRRTPRRPAASERGPHVRGPLLLPPFRLGEGASGRASESGAGGRKKQNYL